MRSRFLALAGLCGALMIQTVPAMAEKPAPKAGKAAKGQQAVKYDEPKLQALEAKLAKKPSDAKLKTEAAEANYQVGHAMMINPDLMPRVKYPGALKKFRRALMLNPKHAKAANERKMIEDIYKSMGRPVPQ